MALSAPSPEYTCLLIGRPRFGRKEPSPPRRTKRGGCSSLDLPASSLLNLLPQKTRLLSSHNHDIKMPIW